MHISRIKSCILFTSCLPWALSAGGSLWLLVSYIHMSHMFFLFSCQWKTAFFFLTHPFASHNVVFVSFWQFIQTSALWEWQAISQTTERVAAKGNKPGPTLRFSPGWFTSSRDSVSHVLIKISKVVILHLPWLSGATIQTTYTKRPHFLSHEMLKSPPQKNCLSFWISKLLHEGASDIHHSLHSQIASVQTQTKQTIHILGSMQ